MADKPGRVKPGRRQCIHVGNRLTTRGMTMQNGNGKNGGAPAAPGHQVTVNAGQAAAFALQFLDGVAHTRAQREAYDVAVMFLQAIASGQLVLAQGAPPPAVAEAPAS